MSQEDFYEDDEIEPRRRPRREPDWEEEDEYEGIRRRPGYGQVRSGAVTAVAVINFVLGTLVLLMGICLLIFFLGAAGDLQRQGALQMPLVGPILGIAIAFVLGIILWGVGIIVAGIGVINRSQWGRILTLVLGGFSILVSILFILGAINTANHPPQRGMDPAMGMLLNFLLAFTFLGHTIFNYVILLMPTYGSEFS